jgi:hypothetical protein
MHSDTACEALNKGVCLELRYSGFSRIVEVHAVGTSTAGNPVMRAWQVRGGSVSNEPVGWKLMRLDEAAGAALTTERSLAPRPGYKQGDRGMTRIFCQL